ncbi:MAG: hypothetical protein HYU97_05315 [Deltaproteobacteria bacterium]|nr:hypothetical protein [Deltaproteobacteria bacterium]
MKLNYRKLTGLAMGLAFIVSTYQPLWAEPPTPESTESAPESLPSFPVIPRIPKLNMYPCTDCHMGDKDYNNQERELKEEHIEMAAHFKNGDKDQRWCHTCHHEKDYLHLTAQNGQIVTFNEAYVVCGQCHGTILRDWKKNIHGRRVGKWVSPAEAQATSCTECHNSHGPKFKALKPMPPPVLPRGKKAPKEHKVEHQAGH